MALISSWGRLESREHQVIRLSDPDHVADLMVRHRPGIAYGMGRSYGDVCLNPGGIIWRTVGLDHLIQFDESNGRLTCEAGVLLRDIQRLMLPRGWTLPVTPGTLLVTVGGAIANDVHGKNHHRCGSFGDHVVRFSLARTDGTVRECSPNVATDWFTATIGGLGLTGIIVEAEIQLQRIQSLWLNTETIPFDELGDFFRLADSSEDGWEHTVAWIDCINSVGRGIFMRANPADIDRPAPSRRGEFGMPFTPPLSMVNRYTLGPFNAAYYHLNRWRSGTALRSHEAFLTPLDRLGEWNRMYGPAGFFQYQSVIPRAAGDITTRSILREIARSGEGSFLAVLKTFGNRKAPGMMSFPQPGVTLALDFPNRGAITHQLLSRLDAIVLDAGGKIYLAKDARSPRNLFEAGHPQLAEFVRFRDPGISSSLSRRLLGD